jgi:hypothetical protein
MYQKAGTSFTTKVRGRSLQSVKHGIVVSGTPLHGGTTLNGGKPSSNEEGLLLGPLTARGSLGLPCLSIT